MPALSYQDLGLCDDVLVYGLLEHVHFWGHARRIVELGDLTKPINSMNGDAVSRIVKTYVDEVRNLDASVLAFLDLPDISRFARRLPKGSRDVMRRLAGHYLGMYHRSAQFDIEVTTRYGKTVQACVISRAQLGRNVVIQGLYGETWQVTGVNEEIEQSACLRDVSIFNERGASVVLFGPVRFVNHDCEPNVAFTMVGDKVGIRTLRPIDIGEQLSVFYSPNFFGRSNRNCLCPTCERMKRNGFDPSSTNINGESDYSDSDEEKEEDPGSTNKRTSLSPPPTPVSDTEMIPLEPLMHDGKRRSRRLRMHLLLFGDPKLTIYEKLKQRFASYYTLNPTESRVATPCHNCLIEHGQIWEPGRGYRRFCRRCHRHAVLYDNLWPERAPLPEKVPTHEREKNSIGALGPVSSETEDVDSLSPLQLLDYMQTNFLQQGNKKAGKQVSVPVPVPVPSGPTPSPPPATTTAPRSRGRPKKRPRGRPRKDSSEEPDQNQASPVESEISELEATQAIKKAPAKKPAKRRGRPPKAARVEVVTTRRGKKVPDYREDNSEEDSDDDEHVSKDDDPEYLVGPNATGVREKVAKISNTSALLSPPKEAQELFSPARGRPVAMPQSIINPQPMVQMINEPSNLLLTPVSDGGSQSDDFMGEQKDSPLKIVIKVPSSNPNSPPDATKNPVILEPTVQSRYLKRSAHLNGTKRRLRQPRPPVMSQGFVVLPSGTDGYSVAQPVRSFVSEKIVDSDEDCEILLTRPCDNTHALLHESQSRHHGKAKVLDLVNILN